MTLNPAYDVIGKGFVQQYYALFDDPAQRPQLVNMYNVDSSFMTFEGIQIQGGPKIMEKLQSLTFQKISRIITAVDSQPMFDGGVLINVLGRLQHKSRRHSNIQCFQPDPNSKRLKKLRAVLTDDDPPHGFSHVFVLKPLGNSFYCAHDIFRLSIHNNA